MSTKLDLATLQSAVRGTAAAFRSRSTLQPAAGDGTKVFPPTYDKAAYATEERRVRQPDGTIKTIPCVLLDSVQAQANRLEDALQAAIDAGRFSSSPIPVVQVDFPNENLLNAVGKITSLQAPHRIADAILRDSLLDDKPFRKSETGEKLDHVSLQNATALYELCPTALVFGIWDSTGPKGGLGAKFQRAFVSEVVGINVIKGAKTSSRIDPLGIQKQAGPVFRTPEHSITLDATQALQSSGKPILFGKRKGKDVTYNLKDATFPDEGRPSAANHGNIVPSVSEGGVTLDYAEQTAVLSLPALRRLHFPLANGTRSQEIDAAGQTVLAALALTAAALASETGFDLRSRCLLWPTGSLTWELLDKPGAAPTPLTIDADNAIKVLAEAVTAAEALGLKWRKEPLKLTPSPQLITLLRRSQELAATGAAETEE
ncbi:CRISPR-associated protein, GSU0053 family [Opitutaceae bacterium TAV1]|nr:CRISPR-associated protein [Opitutaceae bacterium TAV5]EIP96630.1 CRISPR-associated protein, GSU0053 family [Opitutaceae bacterium TAV1]